MAGRLARCAQCGSPLAANAKTCAVCDTPVSAPAVAPQAGASPGSGAPGQREAMDRRLAKLREWAHAAGPLGIRVPELPNWALEFVHSGEDPDRWQEVVRGIERIAQQRIVQSLEKWAQQCEGRLRRLEAYSVDSRLEREEIEDALHAARTGEVARALSTYQQVTRVVALKERHLDQARGELEKLITLLRDMQALDIPVPDDPEELGEELEQELRRGRLADLKQHLREFQGEVHQTLGRALPQLVTRYGDLLVKNRGSGGRVEGDAATLARAARSLASEHYEDSMRELRRLAPLKASVARAAGGAREVMVTEPSRTSGRPHPKSGGEGPPPG
ncbi:MAG TPA: hypothetical protein VGV89_00595 [Thermoplasmata archaeon]|nr:hypothetical protein [Thermoplasmata archaeon]